MLLRVSPRSPVTFRHCFPPPPSPVAGSCLRPGASISGGTLSTPSAVSRMAVWDGCGQMNNDGPVVAPQISRCTSIPFSNTSMFLPLRLWPLSGSQRLETQRLRVIVLVGVRATTLRRCFRTKTLTMTWGAWSISLLRRNLAVLRSSEYIKHERKGSRNQRSKESCWACSTTPWRASRIHPAGSRASRNCC